MKKDFLPILTINVQCYESIGVNGSKTNICMIPFTGTAEGEYFSGKTVGTGVDTQKTPKGGRMSLSARYMLEGKDRSGNECRIFIENQGDFETGFRPLVVTDSPELAYLETAALYSTVESVEGGVIVKIFMEE